MSILHAEWENQEELLVSFPHKNSDWADYLDDIEKFYVEFITTVCKYQRCVVLCDDIQRVENLIEKNENLVLLEVQTNDTWIRDYGPIENFDFGFNGWGLKFASNYDNQASKKIYPNLITKNMILEGGSIDYNGNGILLTTKECLLEKNRNPQWSKKRVSKKLKELFGLEKIIWLSHGYLAGDDTDSHVDTLARFLDEKTIAYVKCDDKEDEHYKELKKMEKELLKTGFNLIALPLPNANYFDGERLPATYCNFVFINNALIVPLYNEKNDEEVLKIFREFFPSRDVIGLDSTVLIRQHGSIHCASCNVYSKL